MVVGRPPWGHIINKDTKKIVPDPKFQHIRENIISMRTEHKMSLDQIANVLTDLKVPNLSGNKIWKLYMVSVVLKRELGNANAKKYNLAKFNKFGYKNRSNEEEEEINVDNETENDDEIENEVDDEREDVDVDNDVDDEREVDENKELEEEEPENETIENETSTEESPKSPTEKIPEKDTHKPESHLLSKPIVYLKIMVKKKYKDMFTEEDLSQMSAMDLVSLLED
jgi:hypothetical protein